MSTSVAMVNSGTVALDSAIRRAMTCWVRVSSWTLTSPLAVPVSATLAAGAAGTAAGGACGSAAGGAWGGAAGAACSAAACAGAAACGAPPEAAASTSAFTIRPPGPVPCSAERSMPCSRAIRRATGEALARPPLPSGEGAAGCAAAGPGSRAAPGRPAGARGGGRGGRRGGGRGPGRRGGRLGGGGGGGGGRPLAAPAVARRLGLLRRLGRRGVAGRRLAAGADAGDDLADGQRVALLGDDRQRAGAVGLVGHRGLVGLDLHELVAAGDLVALGLEPLEDRALFHRVGEARHDDVGHAKDATHEPLRVAGRGVSSTRRAGVSGRRRASAARNESPARRRSPGPARRAAARRPRCPRPPCAGRVHARAR